MQAEALMVHPARVMICGIAESGKTMLAIDLIQRVFAPQIDRFIVLCPTWSTQRKFRVLDHLVPNKKRDVFEDPSEEAFQKILKQLKAQIHYSETHHKPPIRTFLFLDDCGSTQSIHGGRISTFGHMALQLRHLEASAIVIVQNPKLVSPNYRENANHFIFFPPETGDQVTWIENQYNSIGYSKVTMKRILKSGWRGGAEDDDEEFRKHFVYIYRTARSKTRYFSDFGIELTPISIRDEIKKIYE